MAESLNGTTIPPAVVIVDDRGALWSVVNGLVYRNTRLTQSFNVNLLLYFNHVVYHQNTASRWWKWNNAITVGNSWVLTVDPRAPVPVPSPTPAPTPPPALPVGETRLEFYQDGKLVNSGKLVPDGS